MRRWLLLLLVVLLPVSPSAQGRTTLDIYVIDVEGGNATLLVAPSGQSLLIDTGNGGAGAARDAERIMAAVKDAGLTQIDHLITTHYHGDHFGAMAEVARQVPIRDFIDHGPNVQPNAATDMFLQTVYPQLYASARHTIAKPGDRVAVNGLDIRIVTSAGQVLKAPLAGAGRSNPYCAAHKAIAPDPTENAQSVGTHVTFGRFKTVHLGDVTWNKEFELMCPANPLGTVDLFVVSHHGQAISNAPALVHALAPRVMVMNNGTRKGGQPDAMKVLHGSPGLEDLWQLHFSELSGQEYTVPGMFIANTIDNQPAAMPIAAFTPPAPTPGAPPPAGPPANPAPAHNGAAYWIKISAKQDGSFTVTNARNGFTKSYAAK
jgi:beta-lactamase superfamily II metal-dependent hydrolase